MSGLAALLAGHTPPDLYRWHSAAHVADIQHAVEHAGWTLCHLDGWTTEDRQSFMKGIIATLGLPESLGDDLDGLGTALQDAPLRTDHGTVLLWDGWSPMARQDPETFERVRKILAERARDTSGPTLVVVLRGEGPDLDVDELPIKH